MENNNISRLRLDIKYTLSEGVEEPITEGKSCSDLLEFATPKLVRADLATAKLQSELDKIQVYLNDITELLMNPTISLDGSPSTEGSCALPLLEMLKRHLANADQEAESVAEEMGIIRQGLFTFENKEERLRRIRAYSHPEDIPEDFPEEEMTY